MTRTELARLAAAINVLRPDWPTVSLQTFLDRHHAHRPLRDIAVALTWIATDPDSQTPARVNEAGPWWTASRTSDTPTTTNDCPRHPLAQLRVHPATGATDCAGCWADTHGQPHRPIADRGGKPPEPAVRDRLLAAISGATRTGSTEPDGLEGTS